MLFDLRVPSPIPRVPAALFLALIAAAPLARPADPHHGDELPPTHVLTQLERLAPQRPGIVDLYAVVVGADSKEAVFRREVAAVRIALEDRLDARGRLVTLVNDRTLPQPEATLNSLAYVLKSVADRMDPDEDMLYLHITTHGSAEHVLAFRHPRGKLYGLTPEYLHTMLAQTRIRYRIVFISACYSGGFIDPLANVDTLVITAAAKTRQSYGCGNESQITDFSRAFYLGALRQTRKIADAARLAQQITHKRETALRQPHSYPQMQVGAAIEERLRLFEKQVSASPRRPK